MKASELKDDWEIAACYGNGDRIGDQPPETEVILAYADQLERGEELGPVMLDNNTGRVVNGARSLAAYRLARGDDADVPVRYVDMPNTAWLDWPAERSDPVPELRHGR